MEYFFSTLKLLPPTMISLILTSTKLWRWPCSFLYCFLRLRWKTRILSPRPSERTSAVTLAPFRSDSKEPSAPETATMSEKVMAPSSCAAFSMRMVSPGVTRYCFPPVWMTAYMLKPLRSAHKATCCFPQWS